MAPLEQYLIADRDAEMALARSAAPEALSQDAEIQVLGRHGYEDRGCRQERFRMSGAAIMDGWNQRSRVLEFQAACSHMP